MSVPFPFLRQSSKRRATRNKVITLGVYAMATSALLFSLAANAQEPTLSVELNKVEQQDNACRAYFVVENKGTAAYQALKLDLVIFKADGVIGRRFSVDLAPLKPLKKTVKLFDLDQTGCDQIGSVLINEAVDCKSDSGAVADCLAAMTVKSITNIQFSK